MSEKMTDQKKLKIIKVLSDEGDTLECLDYDDNIEWVHKVIDMDPKPIAEEYAWMCDMKAEGRNAHDFVQVHMLLTGLIVKAIGRETATIIMREIAERGGLDGMNGICGFDDYDSFIEFGLKSGRDTGPEKRF